MRVVWRHVDDRRGCERQRDRRQRPDVVVMGDVGGGEHLGRRRRGVVGADGAQRQVTEHVLDGVLVTEPATVVHRPVERDRPDRPRGRRAAGDGVIDEAVQCRHRHARPAVADVGGEHADVAGAITEGAGEVGPVRLAEAHQHGVAAGHAVEHVRRHPRGERGRAVVEHGLVDEARMREVVDAHPASSS